MEFDFKLNEKEAQIILDALVQQPYNVVFDIIEKLQSQAKEQLDKQEYQEGK